MVDNEQANIARLIDANLNRCREGLRVVEDYARFVLEDEALYKDVRNIRHEVDEILRGRYKEMISGRNSTDDAGRVLKENGGKSLSAVLISNFKRAQESLRVLEEYSKIFDDEKSSSFSQNFKRARFKVYAVEKQVFNRRQQL